MSSPTLTGPGALGLVTALLLLTACTRSAAPRMPARPPDPTTPPAAEHVYRPSSAPQSPSVTELPRVRGLTDPRLVAIAEARAVCDFDWRQTLAARIAAARAYATPAYAQALTPSDTDRTNWSRTQQDRESGTCTAPRAYVVGTAPNTPTVRFERVQLTQRITLPGKTSRVQQFAALYRVEQQYDGRWLVGAEGEGG